MKISSSSPLFIQVQSRVIVGLLLVVLVLLFWAFSFFQSLSEYSLDILFQLRGSQPIRSKIVIVGVDEPSLEQLGTWPFPRSYHARLLRNLGRARAIGFDFLFNEMTVTDNVFNKAIQEAPPVVMAISRSTTGRLLKPPPSLEAYYGGGHVEVQLGKSGIARRVRLVKPPDLPALALALLRAAGLPRPKTIDLGAPHLINYYGPEGMFTRLSYLDVLKGRIDKNYFKDALVLVGGEATGLGDTFVTPYKTYKPTAGVEIQATILANLLENCFIREYRLLMWFLLALVFLVALFVWPRCNEIRNGVCNFAGSGLLIISAVLLFQCHIFFNVMPVILFLLLAYLGHLLVQGLMTSFFLNREIQRLDKEIDTNLTILHQQSHLFALPAIDSEPPEGQGVQQQLQRLRWCIRSASIQHHFLANILKEELPPLSLWDQRSGKLILGNRMFYRFLDHYLEAMTPPSFAHFEKALKKRQVAGQKTLQSPVDTPRQGLSFDIQMTSKKGIHYYRVDRHPFVIQGIAFQGILSLLVDITHVRELERIKDEIVDIVSHELKLPLTTILGYSEMLTEQLQGTTQQYAREIQAQTRRLNRLITDFLDIARLEKGRQVLDHKPLLLDRLLADCVEAITPAAASKAIRIDLHCPAAVTPFLGDQSLLTQVVLNLLDNAIKFSPERSRIILMLIESRNHFLIRVQDQGPGIPQNQRARIFDKFYRSGQEQSQQGFGLGLSLVFQVITLHQGTIEILDPDQGTGAVFLIHLPKNIG